MACKIRSVKVRSKTETPVSFQIKLKVFQVRLDLFRALVPENQSEDARVVGLLPELLLILVFSCYQQFDRGLECDYVEYFDLINVRM